jgi:hypothetical protein
LQLRVFAIRAFHSCVDMLSRGLRWLVIPSPGLRYLLAVVTPLIACTAAMLQKALHRILS